MAALQPPRDYTTKISVATSMGEIVGMLTAHKARQVTTMFDEQGDATGFTFTMLLDDKRVDFALPARWQAVHNLLLAAWTGGRNIPDRSEAQARRVAWRQLRHWVDAQMALVEVGMVKMEEVFLPFAVFGWDKKTDQPITAFQMYEHDRLMLPAPG